MTKTLFFVDYKISLVNFDLYINDILLLSNHDGSSIYSNHPCNHLILESGVQSVRLELLPIKGAQINLDAQACIKIMEGEVALQGVESLTTIAEIKLPDHFEETPKLVLESRFHANIPYINEGWINSKGFDLKEDNKSLIDFYRNVYELFVNKKVDLIFDLMKRRYEETDKSLYLSENNLQRLVELFAMLDQNGFVMEAFPESPKIKFYAGKRVVNLVRDDYVTPLIFYKNKENNEVFGFPFFVMKKDGIIEIIR